MSRRQLKIEFPPLARSIATLSLFAIDDLYRTALVAGALSVDAAMGSVKPFDHRIHALRGHQGQIDAAATYRVLLDGSSINVSHADCNKVQGAFAADNLALAASEIGALAEPRTAFLIDATLSGLPPSLLEGGGVNSGFMIAHGTAAALASERSPIVS